MPRADATAAQAEMLANRLRKTGRHRRRWARRKGLTAYRLYDRDIPEVPLEIDWYDGHLHVAERRRRTAGGPEWLERMVDAAAEVCEVPRERVFTKIRRKMLGRDQYQRLDGAAGHRVVVEESGLRFVCNLSGYLDTGLFLDHRRTRAMVGAEAEGKAVLNLFCYTAAFTVHAVAGGARATTSIDLSNTYLAWAAENLEANGFAPSGQHRLVRDDVLAWLPAAARRGETFDLVVVDPPTFSVSKKMGDGESLDVQRDHVRILQQVLALTRPGGVVWFSTNQRTFALDPAAFDGADAVEMTHETVPDDFRKQPTPPHRAWRAVRR